MSILASKNIYTSDDMIVTSMQLKEGKGRASISGKSFDEVRNHLLNRTISLKERMTQRYDKLYNQSLLDNVKQLLQSLKEKEEEDARIISRAMETGTLKMPVGGNGKTDYGKLDHIITDDLSEPDPNDMGSVLLSAIKMSNDLHKVLSIMSEEYKGSGEANIFTRLAQHEMENKVKLSELYDDLINKDYW